MPTITDVARTAGVSISTVSRVLNGNPNVAPEKRESVLAAARLVGYELPRRAEDPSRRGAKIILIITSITLTSVYSALQDAALAGGYQVLFNLVEKKSSLENAEEILKTLKDSVAGVILFNTVQKESPILQKISRRYPTIQVGETFGFPENFSVSTDDVRATRDIVTHLIETGRRRIGFMTIPGEVSRMRYPDDREQGYVMALQEHGLSFDPSLIKYANTGFEGGVEATKQFLAMDRRPDAICCILDSMAFGCVRTLTEAGVAVPREIAVTGFDDLEHSRMALPQITTVAQAFDEIGVEAVRMLDQIIRGEATSGRRLFVDHKLVIRGSTVEGA